MNTHTCEKGKNGVSLIFKSLAERTVRFMDSGRRAFYSYLALLTTVTATTAPTFCAPTMEGIFNAMVNIIKTIAQFTGAGILVFALVSWILAMKDENAEGQSRAIRTAVVGVALVCFGTFAQPIIDMLI